MRLIPPLVLRPCTLIYIVKIYSWKPSGSASRLYNTHTIVIFWKCILTFILGVRPIIGINLLLKKFNFY